MTVPLSFRPRRIFTVVIVFLTCFLFAKSPARPKKSKVGLRAGAAKIDITPKKPVKMAGYASRTGLSHAVHDPLSARVVAFENSGKTLVLASTDLLGFYNGTAEYLRKAIIDEFKFKPSELFLSAIHTHAGPALTVNQDKGHPNNLEYTQQLKAKLIQAVRLALNKMDPVQMGMGVGYSPVGVNRRQLKFDTSGYSSIKLGRNPYGPTDKEVLVMKLLTPQGQTIAALFDYATHATCLGSKNYMISGDVLGLAEQFVEKILGPDVIAPAFAGASGNIDPWFRVLPEFNTEPGWIPEPVLLGTMLGQEVVHICRDMDRLSSNGEIKTAFVTLQLPGKPRNQVTVNKDYPPTPLNITVARLGEVAFVGIGCEVLTEIGLAIKAASPFKHTFVITHCNGAGWYLPPKHLYIQGGYEIKSSPFGPQAADMVVKQTLKMLYELKYPRRPPDCVSNHGLLPFDIKETSNRFSGQPSLSATACGNCHRGPSFW